MPAPKPLGPVETGPMTADRARHAGAPRPGIPQVYYVGLLFGQNDMELLEQTNVGRDINRHY